MKYSLLIVFILTINGTWAQEVQNSKKYSLGINYLPNKVLLHKPNFHILPNHVPQAFEFNYLKQTNGSKIWHQKYAFPEVGVNVVYANYQFQPFGSVIGFYPSIQFRLKSFNISHVYFKIGAGLGLATKSWDRSYSTDSFRYFIGSKLNNFTMFQFGYKRFVSKRFSGQLGLDFYHVSNAATRQPNYGINTTGFFIGINYHPNGYQTKIEKKEWNAQKEKYKVGIFSSIAFAESKAFDGPLYPIYSQSVAITKKYRSKSRLWLSLNSNFKNETKANLKAKYGFQSNLQVWQFSASIHNEFLFGKVGVPLGIGYYLNDPTGNQKLYQKLGMNYYLKERKQNFLKETYFSLLLHTHIAKAQYAEMGLGILF